MAQRYYVFECGNRSIEYAWQKIVRRKYLKVCPECGKPVTHKEFECERCGVTVKQRANQGGDDPKYCLECSLTIKHERTNAKNKIARRKYGNHAIRSGHKGHSVEDELRFLDSIKTKKHAVRAIYRNYNFVRSFTEKEKDRLRKRCEQILGEATV